MTADSGRSRSATSQTSYRPRKRRRKKRVNVGKIILLILMIAAVVLLLVFGIKALKNKNEDTVETQEPESALMQDVTVNGVNITGMGRTEAKNAIEKKYGWKMKARLGNDTFEIANLLEPGIVTGLDSIYNSMYPDSAYTIPIEADQSLLDRQMEEMKSRWNVEMKNGSISGFDLTTETFTFADAQDGYEIDEKSLRDSILLAVQKQDYDAVIDVSGQEIKSEFSAETAKELYKTIGEFVTHSTANADRNNNLNLACKAIDGKVLQPGEEFSFNLTTGNRTPEAGYKEAGAYQNGLVVQEPGGGVCQVASTLYNAVIFSGLSVTERHNHTFEPTYVTPGEDATVSYDGYAGPDLRFTNTTASALVIRAKYEDQTVTCSLYGIPILEEGETIEMHSEKKSESDIPGIIFQDDVTLEIGYIEQVSEGTKGSSWTTNIIHKKDGAVISDEFFHTSIYKGHNPVYKKNPLTAVITASASFVDGQLIRTGETVEEPESSEESRKSSGGPGSETKAENEHSNGPGSTPETSKPESTVPAAPVNSGGDSPSRESQAPGGLSFIPDEPIFD